MAWGVPKIGSLVEAASGNVTLIEPAGIAEGDLMVACIGYRSNAAFTLPTGGAWTLVATQQSSGDTDATNGIASGVMAWAVRGSGAPNLIFTRTAGDVAQGRLICYSGASAAPFDTGTANTLGSASVTVTTGTFNTAEANELIVAMTSAGDTLTASAFDATDPSTASGATDTTTAPTAGTWIERTDNGTGTGADHGLAIADAIRATAGATGTIQATISGSARHVMIAAAFKLSPNVTVALTTISPAPTGSVGSLVNLVRLNDSLNSFWELGEASGTRVDSVTASGNDLTDNATVTQAVGKVGSAAHFTRADSEYLSRADNASLSTGNIDFSVFAWVYLDSKPAAGMDIFGKWDAPSSQREYILNWSNTLDRFTFFVSEAGTSFSAQVVANNFGAPSLSTWYFVMAWHDAAADTINISVNNGTPDSTAYALGVFSSSSAFRIGASADTAGSFWDGRIDQAGFAKRIYNAAERAAWHNGGNGLSYAAFQADEEAQESISGVVGTVSAGSFSNSKDVAVSGVNQTGSVGTVVAFDTLALAGEGVTGSVGIPTFETAPALTSTVGTVSPGTLVVSTTVEASGVAATGAIESYTNQGSQAVSGVNSTGSVGTVVFSEADITAALTSTASTGDVGTVVASVTTGSEEALTGVGATAQAGSVGHMGTGRYRRITRAPIEEDVPTMRLTDLEQLFKKMERK